MLLVKTLMKFTPDNAWLLKPKLQIITYSFLVWSKTYKDEVIQISVGYCKKKLSDFKDLFKIWTVCRIFSWNMVWF
jgi:hypothetical protein